MGRSQELALTERAPICFSWSWVAQKSSPEGTHSHTYLVTMLTEEIHSPGTTSCIRIE